MIDLLNKISGLAFFGFYEPYKKLVTIHFFSEEDKPDVIAYLRRDMSWDIRQIVEEQSELLDDKEVVTILHEPLGIEEMGSTFDEFVRTGLASMAKESHGEDVALTNLSPMFSIFENNSYDGQE